MCPVCLATAAIIAGSATGTGGLTALVAFTFRKPRKPFPTTAKKEDKDANHPDGSSSPQDRLSR